MTSGKLASIPATASLDFIRVDGAAVDVAGYRRMHDERVRRTLELLRELGCRRIVEVGAHPWVMTTALIDDEAFDVVATVSAEETLEWPDNPEVEINTHEIVTPGANVGRIKNYSFNVERRLVQLEERADVVLACEIIEHLIRSPHVMLLNANRWLAKDGFLVVTTPNGAQFMNPLRRASRTAAYRARCYERHSYVYRLRDLVELVELCGFRIERAGYWNPYPSNRGQRIYRLLAKLPGEFFAEKFHRTVYVVARKERDVERLERAPRVYHPSPYWEHVGRAGDDAAEDARGGNRAS